MTFTTVTMANKRRLIRFAIFMLIFLLAIVILLRRPQENYLYPGHSHQYSMPKREWPERPATYQFSTVSHFNPVNIPPNGKSTKELCESFPRHMLDLVQPVLKIGQTETSARINGQMDSASACFAPGELLIFSDQEGMLREHKVIDVLANLPQSYHSDSQFGSYLRQKQMHADGTLISSHSKKASKTGWVLDKFKFLPMVEMAWQNKPEKAFYFFYEADTFVFWDNVFRFLQTFEPDEPLYMGSPTPGRPDTQRDTTTWFANGGPGFVLSRGAVKKLLERGVDLDNQPVPPLTEMWQPLVKEDCCGDSILGWALWDAGVALQGYWPMFNPHSLHGLPFSDFNWCQPVFTLHKSLPEDMVRVFRWEFGQRKRDRPLLYSDLYDFYHPGHPPTLIDWDNGEWDSWSAPPEANVQSFEACEAQCRSDNACLQFNWRGRDKQQCILMRSIQNGKARGPETVKKWTWSGRVSESADFKAGWLRDRIDDWRRRKTCGPVEWFGPSISRIF